MVGTILPIGYGERARGEARVSLWLHAASYPVGAAALGAGLGLIGELNPWHQNHAWAILTLTIVGCLALVYSLRELGLVPVPAPQLKRQVPARWRLRVPARPLSVLYGLELGAGVTTLVAVAGFYVIVVWALTSGSALTGAVVMALYGAGRAVPVVWIGIRAANIEAAFQTVNQITGWQPLVHALNGMLLALVGSTLLIVGVGSR